MSNNVGVSEWVSDLRSKPKKDRLSIIRSRSARKPFGVFGCW